MTRRQIQQLFLRCRDSAGMLDLDALIAEDSILADKPKPQSKIDERRYIRRTQGMPEYLIDKEIARLQATDDLRIKITNPRYNKPKDLKKS